MPPIKGKTMKTATLFAIMLLASSGALADQYVHGYTKSNGTYVQPYHRTNANSIKSDNYSSQGNINPYTGQPGHERNEYSNPPAYGNQRNNQ